MIEKAPTSEHLKEGRKRRQENSKQYMLCPKMQGKLQPQSVRSVVVCDSSPEEPLQARLMFERLRLRRLSEQRSKWSLSPH